MQEETDQLCHSLAKELSSVESCYDLMQKKEKLSFYYEKIAQLAIEAAPLDQENSEEEGFYIGSALLQQEMSRVQNIEGCKNLLQEIQEKSIQKLEKFLDKKERGLFTKKDGTL